MKKMKNPLFVSRHLGIKKKQWSKLNLVNATLNYDINLFIDPLILEKSSFPEIGISAARRYKEYFERIITLLSSSTREGDVAWRTAEKLFEFHEISYTCLGYGTGSVRGAGFGRGKSAATLFTAKEIVDLGVKDVDLFMVLALFEEGVGPDLISDMTTNIILPDLLQLNERVIKENQFKSREFDLSRLKLGRRGLIENPITGGPVLLVPSDIVRDLPIARDYEGIAQAAFENQVIRDNVNGRVGEIWQAKTRKQKDEMKRMMLRDKESFDSVMSLIKVVPKEAYDTEKDLRGEFFWADVMDTAYLEEPLDLSFFRGKTKNKNSLLEIVQLIVNQFQFLLEKRDLWKEVWADEDTHRGEKACQRLFYAVAYSYCHANNIDVTPEAETGNGPVDFKFSSGFAGRVLVEIKLSDGRVVHGYEKQLEIYKEAEQTNQGIFVVIDVGKLGKKDEKIFKLRNEALLRGEQASEIFIIDATPRESASKRE